MRRNGLDDGARQAFVALDVSSTVGAADPTQISGTSLATLSG